MNKKIIRKNYINQWNRLSNKLRLQLITTCKNNQFDKAQVLLNRLNIVLRHRHNRNLANGMSGKAWIDLKLDKVISDIKSH
jgi:hypothetical protein